MSIGNTIKDLRMKQNMSQQELADKAGISRISIGNYERGSRHPNSSVIQQLAKALNVTPTILMGWTDKEKEKFNEMRTHIISNEYRYLSDIAKDCYTEILTCFKFLNDEGATEALKRVSELTEIKKYQKK